MEEQSMTMTDAARVILSERGHAMKVKDLASEIQARELFKFGAKNPSSVLSGAMSKKSDVFERTGPGTYRLIM